jgi:hypothetical protein
MKPAPTPQAETAINIGISGRNTAFSLDRRVSVAPMMDWTDDR